MSQMPNASPVAAAVPDSRRPLDHILLDRLGRASKEHDGFVLSLVREAAGGGPIAIEIKPTLPIHDEWEPLAGRRAHTILDTDSLVAYALKYGNAKESILFFDDDGATLVLNDDTAQRGERERIRLAWELHDDWKAWSGVINVAPVQHRTLRDHLVRRAHTLDDPDILVAMRSVRASMTVKFDSDLKEEAEAVGVAFTATKGDELLKFPKSFGVRLPVLAGDSDEEAYSIEIRVEVILPQRPNDPVSFQLTCAEWTSTLRARLDMEMRKVREKLEDWTVVKGTHQIEPRQLPAVRR